MSTLNETPLSSPICTWALPLTARKGGDFFPSGSAIIIGQNLAITAKHVIEGFMSDLGSEEVSPDHFKHKFALQAAQVLDSGETGVLWNVPKIWRSAHTDIAFLLLSPTTSESLSFQWKALSLDLRPLQVGAKIAAFGYHTPRISHDQDSHQPIFYWTLSPTTSTGIVTEVFHERRDSAFLKFPCYQTSALFRPSMSGGPALTESGCLCGLVCSGIDFGQADAEPVSYVTALWPSMATPVSIDRKGFPRGVTYPVLDLARHGYIHAIGWENVVLTVNPDTGRPRVMYRL